MHNKELLPQNASKDDQVIFRQSLLALVASEIPFTVGGAIAVRAYSGIWRETHDLDVFVKPGHAERVLVILESTGLRLTGSDPEWLYVTKNEKSQVDIIFAFRNQVQVIDDLWVERARHAIVASVPVLVASPEDTIYSKTFILNRERFDWGDCINIMAGLAGNLDWNYLVWRLKDYPALLMAELLFCLQVYPQLRGRIPVNILQQLYEQVLNDKSVRWNGIPTSWFFTKNIVQEVPIDMEEGDQ